MNAVDPRFLMPVFRGALAADVDYMDMAVSLSEPHPTDSFRLPGVKLEVRAVKPGKSIRADWDDGSTRLVIAFTARGDAKSQVALVHERVPDAEAAAELKAWWRGRVAVLKEVLEA